MRRMSERGEGRLGTFIFFALLAAIGLAAWNVVPVYYDHYDFTDAVEEIFGRLNSTSVIMALQWLEAHRAKLLADWVWHDTAE